MSGCNKEDSYITGQTTTTSNAPTLIGTYAIKSLALQIDYRIKGTTEVQLMKMYIKNAPHLKELTLLINQNEIEEQAKEEVKNHYKYAIQIVNNSAIENAILSAEIYKDTIYVAGAFKKINSDTSKKFISKLSNTNIIGNCNILSIFPNLLNNENVVIYPNPFIDQLAIMSDFNESRTLTITNSLGDIVFNQSIINPTTKLNLHDLKAGIYFAIIQTSNNKKVFKLVKK